VNEHIEHLQDFAFFVEPLFGNFPIDSKKDGRQQTAVCSRRKR
jgi:hypothetical protein